MFVAGSFCATPLVSLQLLIFSNFYSFQFYQLIHVALVTYYSIWI